MNVRIDVSGKLKDSVRALAERLEGAGRREMTQAMGVEVQEATRSHLMELAATRHATASRLGGTPTNHWAQAAEKVAAPAALTVAGDAAVLTINHPGIIRAFRDVTIVPRTARFLALPLNGLAYGHRPREFSEVQFAGRGEEVRSDIPAYALVTQVHQPQDRSLLPSDEEWQDAAAHGAETYLAQALTA